MIDMMPRHDWRDIREGDRVRVFLASGGVLEGPVYRIFGSLNKPDDAFTLNFGTFSVGIPLEHIERIETELPEQPPMHSIVTDRDGRAWQRNDAAAGMDWFRTGPQPLRYSWRQLVEEFMPLTLLRSGL